MVITSFDVDFHHADYAPSRTHEGRSAIAKLKQTSWWRPYPDSIRWVPDMEDWDANYEKLMPDMRNVLGWKR